MTNRFQSFDEYEFDRSVPAELQALIEEFSHLFTTANPLPDIEQTWTVQKPAGWVEILYPPEKQEATVGIPTEQGVTKEDYPDPEEIGVFLYEFSSWFHFEFDGFRLFFSRFPTIPPFLAHAGQKRGDAALAGILLGYEPADVAQWVITQGGAFKTERGFEH